MTLKVCVCVCVCRLRLRGSELSRGRNSFYFRIILSVLSSHPLKSGSREHRPDLTSSINMNTLNLTGQLLHAVIITNVKKYHQISTGVLYTLTVAVFYVSVVLVWIFHSGSVLCVCGVGVYIPQWQCYMCQWCWCVYSTVAVFYVSVVLVWIFHSGSVLCVCGVGVDIPQWQCSMCQWCWCGYSTVAVFYVSVVLVWIFHSGSVLCVCGVGVDIPQYQCSMCLWCWCGYSTVPVFYVSVVLV
jgi:hypothetical protein